MPRTDFKATYERITDGELRTEVWYRSPLWSDDHLLGASQPFVEEGLAWCGRPLDAAAEMGDDELGGLYVSERKSGKCSQCRSRQKEWDAR